MGKNISPDGYPGFEIDVNEIIGNSEVIYWMFDIIDRISQNSRLFCVSNDKTSNNIMKILKENVATNENHEMDLDEEYLENTLIFSLCFASYQVNKFREKGYILNRVNHSVWFGHGNFHTNNLEDLWAQTKGLTNIFGRISIGSLGNLYYMEIEKKII